MDYQETIDFLFSQLAMFHKVGAAAYKPGLERVEALSALFGSPHKKLKCVHIAGTNGKGSTAHTLASILQQAGYKTGLFTSPHLIDFRERIRINGQMIDKASVIDFTERYRSLNLDFRPSFFELTTVMAFEYFAKENVDIAIIEAGLGGRLDSTNIINPELSVITNISLDHTSLLGSTAEAIAAEKAGIIKQGKPVVIGESKGEVRNVFADAAAKAEAEIHYADDAGEIKNTTHLPNGKISYDTVSFGCFNGDLCGDYQTANARTILEAVKILSANGWNRLTEQSVAKGFGCVTESTGLLGRWMKISDTPVTVCDTGHNVGGWEHLSAQIDSFKGLKHIVIGFVNDKDVDSILSMVSHISNALLYFTNPSVDRALPADELAAKAEAVGLKGQVFTSVAEAYKKALADISNESSEMIYVGGSTFVVADLLDFIAKQ